MADILTPPNNGIMRRFVDMGDGTFAEVVSLASGGTVQGTVASGSTDSGNPVKVAGVHNTTLPTFTNGQRGDMQIGTRGSLSMTLYAANSTTAAAVVGPGDGIAATSGLSVIGQNEVFNGSTWDRARGDLNGLVVQPALSSTFWNYAAASGGIVNTATAVTIKAAGAAGVRNYLKSLSISHDTLGAATEIAIRDGAAGTVLWRGRLQVTAVEDATLTFDPPLRGTAATLMEVLTITAVTGGVYVNAQGYTGS